MINLICINCNSIFKESSCGGVTEFVITCNNNYGDGQPDDKGNPTTTTAAEEIELKPSTITIKQALIALFNKFLSFEDFINMSSSMLEIETNESDNNCGSSPILQMCMECGNLLSNLYHSIIKLIQQQQRRRSSLHCNTNTNTSPSSCDNLIEQFISGLLESTTSASTLTLEDPDLTQLYSVQDDDDDDDDDEEEGGENTLSSSFEENNGMPNNNSSDPDFQDNISTNEEDPDCPCLSSITCSKNKKLHCHIITSTDRATIRSMFWFQFKSLVQRQEYVRSLVDYVPVTTRIVDSAISKRKGTLIYHLNKKTSHDEEEKRLRVCSQMFLKTLDIKHGRIHDWVPKSYFTVTTNNNDAPASASALHMSPTPEDLKEVVGPPKKRPYKKKIKPSPFVGCAERKPTSGKIHRALPAGPNSPVVLLRPIDKIPPTVMYLYREGGNSNLNSGGRRVTKSSCTTCSQTFNFKWELQLHQDAFHSDIPPKVCPVCGFKSYRYVTDEAHFTSHICSIANDNQLGCDYCGKKLSSFSGFKSHAWSHDNFPNYYSYNSNRKETKRAHRKFPCPHQPACTRSFTLQSFLSNHIHRVHVLGLPDKEDHKAKAICMICGQELRKKYLRIHMKRQHPTTTTQDQDRPCVCPACGSSFKFPEDLKGHIKRVHVDTVKPTMQCPECGRIIKKRTYKSHMARRHNPNKPPRKKRTTKPKMTTTTPLLLQENENYLEELQTS